MIFVHPFLHTACLVHAVLSYFLNFVAIYNECKITFSDKSKLKKSKSCRWTYEEEQHSILRKNFIWVGC